jgi:hypothetical protein
MHEAIASPLEAWASFCVIVGSSAGALTGLQFVVMTLIVQIGPRGSGDTVAAFGTPNVIHFCAALLVASLLTVPWDTLRDAGLAVAGCGMLGIIYSIIVLRRAHRQRDYEPVLEDWIWHTILPALSYWAMFLAGVVLSRNSAGALFVIGAATLLLVFIGIHNAWDTVTYVAVEFRRRDEETEAGAGAGAKVDPGVEAARGPGPGSGSASGAASARESPASRTPGV